MDEEQNIPGLTPGVVELLSPEDGAADQPLTLPFQWRAASHATAYHFQLSASPDFTQTPTGELRSALNSYLYRHPACTLDTAQKGIFLLQKMVERSL